MNFFQGVRQSGETIFAKIVAPILDKRKFTDNARSIQLLMSIMESVVPSRSLSTYRRMMSDDEVISSMNNRMSSMLPDIRFAPGDESDEAKLQAEFITAAFEQLPMGALDTFSLLLSEACQLGFFVAEKHWTRGSIPGFPNAIYLENLRLLPSESFRRNGLLQNDAGIVDTFVQRSGLDNEVRGTLEDAFYYAFQGSPLAPQGVSVLFPAYNPWAFKLKALILYEVLMGVNASGLRIGKMPKADYNIKEKRDLAITVLRKLASSASIVIPDNMELDIQQPTSGVGGHFVEAIREISNKAIRKSIIYDEVSGAEGKFSGGLGNSGKESAEEKVNMALLKQGKAFMYPIRRQLIVPMLAHNGFNSNVPPPIPIPIPAKEADGNPLDVIEGIGTGIRDGVFTVVFPDNVQTELARRALQTIDVKFDKLLPTPKEIPLLTGTVEGPDDDDDNDPDPDKKVKASRGRRLLAASNKAPAGRTPKDIKRRGREYDKILAAEQEKVLVAGEVVTNAQIKALDSALFSGDAWSVKNSTELRIAIQDNIKAGAREYARVIDKSVKEGWTVGVKHARDIIDRKIHAASGSATPKILTETAAEALFRNRRLLKLDEIYGEMSNDLFNILNNLVDGKTTTQVATNSIRQYLQDNGFSTPGQASTILNTNFASAYNRARMNTFSEIEDPTGQIPGSITSYLYSIILDGVTTDICISLDGTIWMADDPYMVIPPAWYNCRSTLIPIFAEEEPWTGKLVDRKESQRLASFVDPKFGSVA